MYVNKRRRGMGATPNCPSVEQLLGISDPSDPCQNASAVTPTGAPATASCPSAEQLAGIVDPSDPCQAAGAASSGTVATNATGITALLQSITNAFAPASPAGAPTGSSCFSFAFPWMGTYQNGVCTMPAGSVSSSVGTLITVGVATVLLIALFKKK